MARNSKGGWLLYVMIGVPWIFWVKIGITHISIGAIERAFDVGKAFVGFAIPIMVIPLPGAYYFEQRIHRILKPLSFRFYKGDGASEWFWFPALFFVLPIMFAIFGLYLAAFDAYFGTKALPVVAGWFFETIFYWL